MIMTFKTEEALKEAGFSGFTQIKELMKDCSCIPPFPGVYLVYNLSDVLPEFLPTGTGGLFKGRNPNVPVEELANKWVNDTMVVYVGKATSLKKRIQQYLGFGQGKSIGHYGGRYIWQLRNSTELGFCWKLCSDPRLTESELIQLFLKQYGKLPFANLVG
jgi:hypothetical protein